MSTLLSFVQSRLTQPGVSLKDIEAETGVSLRSLQMMKAGIGHNVGAKRIEDVARQLGYEFKPVPISRRKPTEQAATVPTQEAA